MMDGIYSGSPGTVLLESLYVCNDSNRTVPVESAEGNHGADEADRDHGASVHEVEGKEVKGGGKAYAEPDHVPVPGGNEGAGDQEHQDEKQGYAEIDHPDLKGAGRAGRELLADLSIDVCHIKADIIAHQKNDGICEEAAAEER